MAFETVEVPPLTVDERERNTLGTLLGLQYTPIWYLRRHHGAEEAESYIEHLAERQVETVKLLGLDGPLPLLRFTVANEESLLGAQVLLRVQDEGEGSEEVELEFRVCERLRTALQWAETADEADDAATITRDEYCRLCHSTSFAPLAEALGLTFEVDLEDQGCRLRFGH